MRLPGLHHITAIASNAQRNIDFYTRVLGLRLVKKTVNFDDPSAYHLYYGDAAGTPGSIITFFYWPDAPKGRIGAGQSTGIVFSAPAAALGFWQERLARHGYAVIAPDHAGDHTAVARAMAGQNNAGARPIATQAAARIPRRRVDRLMVCPLIY